MIGVSNYNVIYLYAYILSIPLPLDYSIGVALLKYATIPLPDTCTKEEICATGEKLYRKKVALLKATGGVLVCSEHVAVDEAAQHTVSAVFAHSANDQIFLVDAENMSNSALLYTCIVS